MFKPNVDFVPNNHEEYKTTVVKTFLIHVISNAYFVNTFLCFSFTAQNNILSFFLNAYILSMKRKYLETELLLPESKDIKPRTNFVYVCGIFPKKFQIMVCIGKYKLFHIPVKIQNLSYIP